MDTSDNFTCNAWVPFINIDTPTKCTLPAKECDSDTKRSKFHKIILLFLEEFVFDGKTEVDIASQVQEKDIQERMKYQCRAPNCFVNLDNDAERLRYNRKILLIAINRCDYYSHELSRAGAFPLNYYCAHLTKGRHLNVEVCCVFRLQLNFLKILYLLIGNKSGFNFLFISSIIIVYYIFEICDR